MFYAIGGVDVQDREQRSRKAHTGVLDVAVFLTLID